MSVTAECPSSAMGTTQQTVLPLTLVTFLLTSSSWAADQVRLAGPGSTPCSGTVEIYHAGAWGTVCDDGWDLKDAQVVCRQLGCGGAMSAVQSAVFGQGTGEIWLSRVGCSGSERTLAQCSHGGFRSHRCGHSDDAGVVCSGVQVRLVGSTLCSGRVEIQHNGVWGTVCDNSWDLPDAEVVCRQMNCGAALSATHAGLFGQLQGRIWLNDVACEGSEGSLTQCQHSGFGKHNCKHDEGAGVICSVSLPKPHIHISPAGEVTWGQDVSITCSTSALLTGGKFILLKTLTSFRQTKTTSLNSATFTVSRVDFDFDGSYVCQHEINISGWRFNSLLSDVANVSVIVSFPKPSISMVPVGEVTWGQAVAIQCSIATQILGGTFLLKKASDPLSRTRPSISGSATFSIPRADFDDAGSYWCHYQTRSSSHEFTSPASNPVRVVIAVRLQRPTVSLTPMDAGPTGAEVTSGHSFVLTCSINSSYSKGSFFLTSSARRVSAAAKPAVNNSASFIFPAAEWDHQGNYTCVYEVTLGKRRFNSTEAVPICVTIKTSLLLLVSLIVVGFLPLLLLVLPLLVVFLVCRKRPRTKQPSALVQTPMLFRDRSAHGDNDVDYVNIDIVTCKRNLREARRAVEIEGEYEEPLRHGSQGYDEAGLRVNYTEAKWVFANAEKSRGEEETGDEESDYENVLLFLDQQIGDEDEDIYENF